ncbi:TerC family protein [Comamonas thiooxydans]|uniref:TerC family protein n=1 Tax=Comamonas thiooxydans TaxID=363952 RepID=UPI000B419256|nr:TerC family protein [Comamonas thiooxydans]
MEFLQTIEWAAVLKIIGIDIMLGVDNAIVIALACAALPAEVRNRAIIWGTAGAIGLRAILLVFAGFLMGLPYVKLIAGAYLLFLGYKLLMSNDEAHDVAPADRIMTAIKTIIVADFMMSLDNVLAVTAAAQAAGEHSTIYAILGIILSIPVIIFGAKGLMQLMEKFPIIIWLGAGLLGWVGMEMMITDHFSADFMAAMVQTLGSHAAHIFQLGGFLIVIVAAFLMRKLKRNSGSTTAAA